MANAPQSDNLDAGLPSVSVVIPAYTMERWPLLKKGVESVRRQTREVEAIVVCIDNNDELLGCAQAEWDSMSGVPVRVIANRHDEHLAQVAMHQRAHGTTRRFGAGSGRNTAAETVTSDIVAFMDDDAWAEPDWIEQLLTVYEDQNVVSVGGAPLPEFESNRPAWFPRNFDWVFGCAYEGLPATIAPLRHLIGANMSVRREAFAAVGGFLGSDFDDLNLCMRLAERYGEQSIYYSPSAVVHHYVPTQRTSWRYFWRRCYFVNREKVAVFRRIGSAANLVAEREFVARSFREQMSRELRRGLSGDANAIRAVLAMIVGIGLAGAGHMRGRLAELNPRSRNRRPQLTAR